MDKPIDFVVPNFQTNPEGISCYSDSCCGIAPDRENFGSCFSQHSAAGAANARCSARDQTNQTITTERHGKQRRKIQYTHIITYISHISSIFIQFCMYIYIFNIFIYSFFHLFIMYLFCLCNLYAHVTLTYMWIYICLYMLANICLVVETPIQTGVMIRISCKKSSKTRGAQPIHPFNLDHRLK